jgi:crotonobetainyl-CoA:carnitine CoA-transferase CaiB-like acyl-CoA transferase
MAVFFVTHTKKELLDMAIGKGIMLLPVSTPDELLKSPQLQDRDYWTKVEHPELGETLTYPGSFVKSSAGDCKISRRAPLIGEHNEEIYTEELGLSREELARLKEAGVI